MSDASPAHHGPDGRFRNPWPDAEPQPFSALLRWWRDRWRHGVPADPPRTVFDRREPAFASPRADPAALGVTWVGHATVLLQLGGLNILTAPMWGERASPLPVGEPRRWVPPGVALDALPPIDIVLLSHSHYDHFDTGTIRALARRHPAALWCVPLRLAPLVQRLGVRATCEADWWASLEVRTAAGTARVGCTPAQHFSARVPWDRNRTLWCGWTLEAGGRRVFFAGDTGHHPEFRRIGERFGPVDLALMPVGAYEPRWFMRAVHLTPEEAVQGVRELQEGAGMRQPPAVVPIHWGTFKLTDEPMDEPPRRTVAAWQAAGLPDDRLWLLRHGETRAASFTSLERS